MYLNNAATSFPKPPQVIAAVSRALESLPVESGRSGSGVDVLTVCRSLLAELFSVKEANRVILTPSATVALNAVIWGCLRHRSGHVISTILEHNSVLRPLAHWRRESGGDVELLSPDVRRQVPANRIRECIRPATRLIVVTHASNVTGWIQPVEDVAEVAAKASVPMLIDASQSAGAIPLHMDSLPGRVFVVAAGHKGLYGPSGTGLLIVPDGELPPLIQGGTGIRSESEFQPVALPLLYEAGTPNLPGFAGLCEGVGFVLERGVHVLGGMRAELTLYLRDRLADIKKVRIVDFPETAALTGILSFIVDGPEPDELGYALREIFEIEVRTGLHCAPPIHRFLGTAPKGTVRVSFGAFNTREEIDLFVDAVQSLVSHDSSHRATAIRRLLGSIAEPGVDTRRAAHRIDNAAAGTGGCPELLP